MGQGVVAQRRRMEDMWRRIEKKHGLLTGDEIERSTGIGRAQIKASGALAVTRGGVPVFPGFQFFGGGVRPGWKELTRPLLDAGWSSSEVLVWFCAPTGWLGGRVPVEVLDTCPEDVRTAVSQVALGTAD
jgi:hypothetical protein